MGKDELVFQDLIARGKGIGTAKLWRQRVARFVKVCGNKDEYGRADVITFVAHLRENGVKQNSINSILKSVRLLAQVQGWEFPEIAMPKVKKSDVTRPQFEYDELCSIIRKCKEVCSPREIAFLALASTFGLRREELGTLTIENGRVESHAGMVVHVNTLKGGEPVTQIIPEEIKDIVVHYQGCTDVRYMSRLFNRIVSKCGFQEQSKYGWHSIRRALATELVMRDVSALNIMRFMRWSDMSLKGEFGMLVLYARREQDKIDKSIFQVHPFLPVWAE